MQGLERRITLLKDDLAHLEDEKGQPLTREEIELFYRHAIRRLLDEVVRDILGWLPQDTTGELSAFESQLRKHTRTHQQWLLRDIRRRWEEIKTAPDSRLPAGYLGGGDPADWDVSKKPQLL